MVINQRVQFNRETLQPYKSQAYVKFGENLYMDRFMDNGSSVKRAKSKAIQSELNACRDRVRLLVEGNVSLLLISDTKSAYRLLGVSLHLRLGSYHDVPERVTDRIYSWDRR